MRVIFAGTPEFAQTALAALLQAGFTVPLVLTQPDRPAGRGMQLLPSPVKQLALERGIALSQPRSLRLDGKYAEDASVSQAQIQAAQADVMVVAAYGLLLPQWVLDAPRLGCLNIHASLLPRWRGAAPIHRAIEAGDRETGITIMQMDAGLDTGAMLLREGMAISAQESTATLHDRLAALGGRMVVQALELAACAGLVPTPQPQEGVTYAEKIRKEEAAIDWRQSAAALARKSRAFDPYPGCTTALRWADGSAQQTLKIWRMQAQDGVFAPAALGAVLATGAQGLLVACGESGRERVRVTELQKPGGKRLAVADFLQGFPVHVGAVLH